MNGLADRNESIIGGTEALLLEGVTDKPGFLKQLEPGAIRAYPLTIWLHYGRVEHPMKDRRIAWVPTNRLCVMRPGVSPAAEDIDIMRKD